MQHAVAGIKHKAKDEDANEDDNNFIAKHGDAGDAGDAGDCNAGHGDNGDDTSYQERNSNNSDKSESDDGDEDGSDDAGVVVEGQHSATMTGKRERKQTTQYIKLPPPVGGRSAWQYARAFKKTGRQDAACLLFS
jgi:hypothetical protein